MTNNLLAGIYNPYIQLGQGNNMFNQMGGFPPGGAHNFNPWMTAQLPQGGQYQSLLKGPLPPPTDPNLGYVQKMQKLVDLGILPPPNQVGHIPSGMPSAQAFPPSQGQVGQYSLYAQSGQYQPPQFDPYSASARPETGMPNMLALMMQGRNNTQSPLDPYGNQPPQA